MLQRPPDTRLLAAVTLGFHIPAKRRGFSTDASICCTHVHRMVRVGDVFECGVVASAPDAGTEPLIITVTATVTSPSGGTLPPTKAAAGAARRRALLQAPAALPLRGGAVMLLPSNPFSRVTSLTAARQQRTVRFRFAAAAVGEAGLRFDVYLGGASEAARAASGGTGGAAAAAAGDYGTPVDAASFDVPVLGRQRSVFVATSFALQAAPAAVNGSDSDSGEQGGGGGQQYEGLALPAAEPGTGTVSVLAGVGNLPFLQVRR